RWCEFQALRVAVDMDGMVWKYLKEDLHKISETSRLPDELRPVVSNLGLQAVASSGAPSVVAHPIRAARVALVHTWLTTQDEGWWRHAMDDATVPFTYISTQTVARDSN